jgi:CubicO group peptidase (beta-lactamase class C family)
MTGGALSAGLRRADLVPQLAELIERHGVAGASAGILANGRPLTWSAGVASHLTGQAVTPGTLFHIASITKLFTAVATLQLISDGRASLDQPVSELLPGVLSPSATGGQPVTIRHLLTHTSGIDGDFFLDTGPDSDALARYAAGAAAIPRPFQPGQVFSYGNAGFSLLGRLVEVVTGGLWDRELARRILRPAGMTRTTTSPEQALRWPFAVGHERGGGGRLRAATGWPVPRSMGPAGVLCTTAADLLRFGAAFTERGADRPGGGLLPASLVAQMRSAAVTQVYSAFAPGWGLGWARWRWGDADVIGHDGGSRGYESFLRVLPGHDAALVLLTNGGGDPAAMLGEIFSPLVQELWQIPMSDPVPPSPHPGPERSPGPAICGTYRCGTWRLTVMARAGALEADLHPAGMAARELGRGPIPLTVRPAGGGRFAVGYRDRPASSWPLYIEELAGGPRFAHMWGRAARLAA